MNGQWEWHERGGHGCWVNDTLMLWICEYPEFKGLIERHFRVYKPIESIKNVRPIWSANNVLIGRFATFDEAKEACEMRGINA